MPTSELLDVAIEAAQEAGAVLLTYYKQRITAQDKGRSIVSQADTAAEKVILERITKNFPDHRIYSEEAGDNNQDNEFVWVIDPLDGTTNFVHRFARFCTSIGLLRDGKPYLGVVYEPVLDELFAAELGGGATLNGQTITPSKQTQLDRAVIQIGRGSVGAASQRFGEIVPLLNQHVRTLRAIGATALAACYTADGRFDAHVGSHTFLYDGIAGSVIASEAGAVVSDFAGEPWHPAVGGQQDLLITNQALHSAFVELLQ